MNLKWLAVGVSARGYSLACRMLPARFPPDAFHRDRVYQRVMLELACACDVSAFVETGTYKGAATAFIAERCGTLPVHSVEIDYAYHLEAAQRTERYPSVHLAHGSSPPFLATLLEGGCLGDRPLFYLDAHWYNDWPLPVELELIAHGARSAIIVIDDFQVPGRNQFGFDTYGGRACNLDLIRRHLGSAGRHRFVVPNYSCREAFGLNHLERFLAGWVIIFQDLDDLCQDFVTRPSTAGVLTMVDA